MEGQIKNKWDWITLKKIGLEGLKLACITGSIFTLKAVLDLDLGEYAVIAVPIIRWIIGNLEQFNKGE